MSRGTLDTARCNSDFVYGTFTLSGLTSQTVLLSYCSHVAVRTPERTRSGLGSSVFAYGAFTLSGRSFQDRSANNRESIMQSEPRHARTSVWALSISLAATLEIENFLSLPPAT